MNTTQHHVNRDMIYLYFLGILHPDDCRRVEKAIRTDEDLMAYFRRQLALAELTDKSDLEANQEFVHYLGLSMDESSEAAEGQTELDDSQSSIDEGSQANGKSVIPFLIAKEKTFKKSAADRPPVSQAVNSGETVDELTWQWKQSSHHTILLEFRSSKRELRDLLSMEVDVEFQGTIIGLNRVVGQQITLSRSPNRNVRVWSGELCLNENETVLEITSVKGRLNA